VKTVAITTIQRDMPAAAADNAAAAPAASPRNSAVRARISPLAGVASTNIKTSGDSSGAVGVSA
jgi:hypothetical protein